MDNSTKYIISFDSPRLGYGKVTLNNPFLSGIPAGITTVVGRNGSGKTTLGTILEKGRYAYGNRLGFSDSIKKVKMITFTDIHALTGIDVQSYSQRLESTANDYVPTVKEIFKDKINTKKWSDISTDFALSGVENKKINYLSSGELRKVLIINSLLDEPDLLILDNPYIGLDAASRAEFDIAIQRLKANGISVIFLLCDYKDIPLYTDSLINISNNTIGSPLTDREKIAVLIKEESNKDYSTFDIALPPISPLSKPNANITFSIRNGHARYGEKQIFNNLNWEIKRGECWALTGPNGSGKSLLLSMVCADNPQGYANDIILFDRKRGSGESIWDIKDAIGYVCPEMQLYFRSNDNVKEIVVQGLRNSLNRYKPSTPEERDIASVWMRLLGISEIETKKFNELSSGEQRIVLLARALIKQPDLLVLDEPLHGLDAEHKASILRIISALTERNGLSLIYVSHYDNEIPDCVSFHKTIGK